ncbi:MAG: biotin--protein ligase [Chloroflexota bacterium]
MSVPSFHGECKTPGGKLVIVDFDLLNHRLHNVRVSGDFFLYPEEALADITAALEGLPDDCMESFIAERVQSASTVWLGSSPAALAAAVRRALSASLESAR